MQNIDEKGLKDAIDDYELYSPSQRTVLRVLVAVAIDGIASVTNKYLIQATNLSRYSVHLILKKLCADHFIEPVRLEGTRHDSFKINYLKLNQVIQLHLKKQTALQNK